MYPIPATGYRYVILALVLCAQVVVPLALFSIAPLASLLRDLLQLSREQIGALTACFSACVALIGIGVGCQEITHMDSWGCLGRTRRQ
jgi:hypothetical protein